MAMGKTGWFARLRATFKFSLFAAGLIGALLFAGAQHALEQTNTLAFCISCHEMQENNYVEYRDTIHARNRTGVKAICSDCHVPHEPLALLERKIWAANDVVQHFLGKIDTPEKFEAHRAELAKRVWRRMKESDSRECRNCHDVEAMDPERQGRTANKQHAKVRAGEKTCIDCHYGIAHREPAGGLEPQDALSD